MDDLRPSKLKEALFERKARGESAVVLGTRILDGLRRLGPDGLQPKSRAVADELAATVDAIGARGLPSLQKELGEALRAGDVLAAAMATSEAALRAVLDLVRFRYGATSPLVLAFFTPPNERAFGKTAGKRRLAHARLDEAAARHAGDFREDDRARFAAAAAAGEALGRAADTLAREGAAGWDAAKEMVRLLAAFRDQVSSLRRRLKGELDDPDAVYDIIPRVLRRKPEA